MSLKILLVDDHPLITEAYKNVFLLGLNEKVEIYTLNTLKEAYKFILRSEHLDLDYVFLDLSMPADEEKNIFSGEDFAKLIRKNYPQIKIIIITGFYQTIRITNIQKQIFPEGIIAKGEIDSQSLLVAFNKIRSGEIFKSEIIKKNIQNFYDDESLDDVNKKIITLIAEGKKTKNIQKILNLSKSAIDKRKVKIKEYLKIEKGSDEDIIKNSTFLKLI